MHPEVTSHNWNGQHTKFTRVSVSVFIPYIKTVSCWFESFVGSFTIVFPLILKFSYLIFSYWQYTSSKAASWSIYGSVLEVVVHIQSVWFFIYLNYHHVCKSYLTNCLFPSNINESWYWYVFVNFNLEPTFVNAVVNIIWLDLLCFILFF